MYRIKGTTDTCTSSLYNNYTNLMYIVCTYAHAYIKSSRVIKFDGNKASSYLTS